MVYQSQYARSHNNLRASATKNFPMDQSEMTYPEQTADGRHLINYTQDHLHNTKRSQALGQNQFSFEGFSRQSYATKASIGFGT